MANELDAEDTEILNRYLEIGALTIASYDGEGSPIYEIQEISKEIAPELWESHQQHVDKVFFDLLESEDAFVEFDEDLKEKIFLTDRGFDVAKEYGIVEI
jgi:hypothetical protein